MANIRETIAEVEKLNPALARQLKKYVKDHSYGLVYENNLPEAVRLYTKLPAVGDTVNLLPPPGTRGKAREQGLLDCEKYPRRRGCVGTGRRNTNPAPCRSGDFGQLPGRDLSRLAGTGPHRAGKTGRSLPCGHRRGKLPRPGSAGLLYARQSGLHLHRSPLQHRGKRLEIQQQLCRKHRPIQALQVAGFYGAPPEACPTASQPPGQRAHRHH